MINLRKTNRIRSYGKSMFPLLQDGDVVYYKPVSKIKLQTNDLILVKSKKTHFFHRVVYVGNEYFITKGDNNAISDGKVRRDQIIGKVSKINRNGSYFKPEIIYLFQSSTYFEEILAIKNKLESKRHIPVFLKGLPLHLYYEGTHPRRLYADCDLLISPNMYFDVSRILKTHGFTKMETSLSRFHKNRNLNQQESNFVKKINGMPVVFDIHTEAVFMMTQLGRLNSLYPSKKLDQMTDEFISLKRQIKVHNDYFYILSAHHLVTYLGLHLFHHNFRGAFRFDFLNTIIKKESKRNKHIWEQFDLFVNEYNLSNYMYPVFLLLKKYYKTAIPQKTMQKLKKSSTISKKMKERLLTTPIFDGQARSQAGIERFKFLFFLSPVPFWRRVGVFLNPIVIYTMIFLIYKRILLVFKQTRVKRKEPNF